MNNSYYHSLQPTHYKIKLKDLFELVYDEYLFYIFKKIDGIPDNLKELYRTVWEVSQKSILKMAADRGAYIDQSQSLNVHIAEPNYGKITSMHFYGWHLVSVILIISSYIK